MLEVILEGGRTAVELTFYLLLPILVVMMALMRLLEAKGVLAAVARVLAPVLRPFGVPGVGVFAMLQMLLVSFAAPATTLKLMEEQEVSRRGTAATLALILALSQANAFLPLLAVGLSLPLILFTSLVGGLVAAAVTNYVFWRSEEETSERTPLERESVERKPMAPEVQPEQGKTPRIVDLLLEGGQQGVQLSLRAIPSLVLALCVLKVLVAVGTIPLLEASLSPLLDRLGLPGVAVLPLATKYLAGGTAMLGVVTDLIDEEAMSVVDLNRLAGFMINPLDFVGIAVLCPRESRAATVMRPAILGAGVGILLRGVLHLLLT